MKAHRLAKLFPPMPKARLSELALDIKKCGLRNWIVLYENQILDGVQREAACRQVGVTPKYIEFEKMHGKDGGPLAFVMSENFHRRDLTPDQRAGVSADVAPLFEAEARERQRTAGRAALVPSGTKGKAAAKAAEAVGISERQVFRALKVKREAPEKHEEVKSGRKKLSQALRELPRKSKPKPKKDLSLGLTRDSSLRSLFGKCDGNGGAVYVEIGDYGVRVRRLTCAGERT